MANWRRISGAEASKPVMSIMPLSLGSASVDPPAAIDRVDIRQVVLTEDDDPQLVAGGQGVARADGAGAGGIEIDGPEIRTQTAAEREDRGKGQEECAPLHRHRR